MRPADGGSLPIGQTKLKNNSAALSIRQSTRHLRAHGRHHMQDPETPRLNSASANLVGCGDTRATNCCY
jgi:hypothetical protein